MAVVVVLYSTNLTGKDNVNQKDTVNVNDFFSDLQVRRDVALKSY